MSGPNFNGKYSICHYDIDEEDPHTFHYHTLIWGFDTEEEAVAALPKVAEDRGIDPMELAVIGAVFPAAI